MRSAEIEYPSGSSAPSVPRHRFFFRYVQSSRTQKAGHIAEFDEGIGLDVSCADVRVEPKGAWPSAQTFP